MPSPPVLLFTCEHGGNHIPPAYRDHFDGLEAILESHAGYDARALPLARALSREFNAPLFSSDVSRLLVDLNRSLGHRGIFSQVTRSLPFKKRERILEEYYLPHHRAVAAAIAANRANGFATLHIGVHSFTPVLNGVVRGADVGLLYDPARPAERTFCARWKQTLHALAPALAVRCNVPYRGTSDGLTTGLRRAHPASAYLGVELEMNQKFLADAATWEGLCAQVTQALRRTITEHWDCRPRTD